MQKYSKFRRAAMCGLLLLTCRPAVAQSTLLPAATTPSANLSKFVLEDGTPIKLRTGRTVCSADAHVGDLVDLVVIHDVMVDGMVVISQGSIAMATIVEVHSRRRMGRGGKFIIRFDSIQLSTGEKAALRSEKEVKGGGHTTAMATGMAVAAATFLPAAPALIFVRGKDSTLLQGTELTAYINGNLPLDPANFRTKPLAEPFLPSSAAFQGSPASLSTPARPMTMSQILELLPRRVLDSQGNEGDMVNLLFVGTPADIKQAFESAGWVETIHSKRQAVLHASHHPKNNVAMPMSQLFLFGRPQDYSYAINDSVSTTTRRHHLRIWKSDYEIGGSPVWVGAATHDIGIEKDARKLAVTHKIDPEVDAERDFVSASIMKTQLLTESEYVLPPSDTITKANTATGGKYHSDGQMVLLVLKKNENPPVAVNTAKNPL